MLGRPSNFLITLCIKNFGPVQLKILTLFPPPTHTNASLSKSQRDLEDGQMDVVGGPALADSLIHSFQHLE